MNQSELCPCHSQKNFHECCEPFLTGKKKCSTAVQLLRSRYTAFTQKNLDYVVGTHHSETVDQIDHEGTKQWMNDATWHNLEILEDNPGEQESNLGFVATFSEGDKVFAHKERALFKKEKGEWKFFDGIPYKQTPVVNENKTGRNDPCPCGSGKKFKKCCG